MKEYQDTTHTHTHKADIFERGRIGFTRGYFKTGLPKIVTVMSI